MKRQGFTFLDTLIALSIIAILAAIATPVFQSVKASTAKTKCSNQLRQIWVGLQLYREEQEWTLSHGDPYAMGLPYPLMRAVLTNHVDSQLMKCHGQSVFKHFGYMELVAPRSEDTRRPTWEEVCVTLGDSTPLMIDPNHDHSLKGRTSPLMRHRTLVLTVGGSVLVRDAKGLPTDLENYFP